MADLTPEVLDQLQAAAEKATPGPWRGEHRAIGLTIDDDEDGFLGLELYGPPEPSGRGQFARSADVKFIVASREWLLPLVQEVRRLRDDWQMLGKLLDNADMTTTAACRMVERYREHIRDLERQVAELKGEK